ncbi:unnamed protein product [Acanthosepion pharaonis]|uniref:Uncharacterized protein n=1 Tax=Acanthosepion pharaonis TaxID=158019 RepID=A0A812BTR8_ACAPH|nr:unnamed protein product [Sepia pharaonis]
MFLSIHPSLLKRSRGILVSLFQLHTPDTCCFYLSQSNIYLSLFHISNVCYILILVLCHSSIDHCPPKLSSATKADSPSCSTASSMPEPTGTVHVHQTALVFHRPSQSVHVQYIFFFPPAITCSHLPGNILTPVLSIHPSLIHASIRIIASQSVHPSIHIPPLRPSISHVINPSIPSDDSLWPPSLFIHLSQVCIHPSPFLKP